MKLAAISCVLLVACGGPDEYFIDAGGSPDTTPIDGAADNHEPEASAGPDQRAMVDQRVTLAGSATDKDGDALTYAWTQTAGPTATLDDATSETPSFLLRGAGTYTFSLVVSDDEDSAPADTVDVLVHDVNGGDAFTVSLEPDGGLWAWGAGLFGQLGDATNVDSHAPVRVCAPGATNCTTNPFTDVVAISTGFQFTLALKSDGTVWAWGTNLDGALGNPVTLASSNVPVPVCRDVVATDCTAEQLDDVVAIAAGYRHAVALKADGTLWSWGFNGDGELGNGVEGGGPYDKPAPVCAVDATGTCSVANANILTGITMVAAGGGGHTIAQATSGALFAFGHNKSGQVGMGADNVRVQALPTQVCAPGQTAPCTAFLDGVVAFDAMSGHSLALDADGALWAWGGNDEGELGQVTATGCLSAVSCAPAPSRVCTTYDEPCTTPLAGVRTFSAGRRYSVASLDDGTVRAWGDNSASQIGNARTGAPQPSPTRVCAIGQAVAPCTAFLDDIVGVSAGGFHTIAITSDGSLVAWGANDLGQLGIGAADAGHPTPVAVTAH